MGAEIPGVAVHVPGAAGHIAHHRGAQGVAAAAVAGDIQIPRPHARGADLSHGHGFEFACGEVAARKRLDALANLKTRIGYGSDFEGSDSSGDLETCPGCRAEK